MKSHSFKHKLCYYTTLFLLLLVGINALVAGYLFMADPTGHKMGIELSYLQNAPFDSFLIPGFVLFVAIGCLSIYTAYQVGIKTESAPYVIMLQSSLLTGWILVQIVMIQDFNGLHALMLLVSAGLWRCSELLLKTQQEQNF